MLKGMRECRTLDAGEKIIGWRTDISLLAILRKGRNIQLEKMAKYIAQQEM